MTAEQYNECKKYEGIINLFVTTGQYVGGAESLFDYYNMSSNERGCNSCKAAFLIDREIEMRQYAKHL